ncbi:MAG: 4Fe-4S dicluster domain-containing protein [Thermoplasmata archaeon]|nr:MAG: 4Fe-4S dicluster domain-containing protein [Thermoplasmata archaeon]
MQQKGGESIRLELSKDTVNSDAIKAIEELSGQKLLKCYQCGKCSAGCPLVEAMDILPNQIIRLLQLGQDEEALNAKTIWICASCFTCEARCPKGVDLSKIMEALRVLLLRKGVDFIEVSNLSEDELSEAPQQLLVCSSRKFTR